MSGAEQGEVRFLRVSREQRDALATTHEVPTRMRNELVAEWDAAVPGVVDSSWVEVVEARVRVSNPVHWRLSDPELTDAAVGHAVRRIARAAAGGEAAADVSLLAAATDALDVAWGIIANAGMNIRPAPVAFTLDDGTEIPEAGWCRESEEWVDAATRWRDERWHPLLERLAAGGERPSVSLRETIETYLRDKGWRGGDVDGLLFGHWDAPGGSKNYSIHGAISEQMAREHLARCEPVEREAEEGERDA